MPWKLFLGVKDYMIYFWLDSGMSSWILVLISYFDYISKANQQSIIQFSLHIKSSAVDYSPLLPSSLSYFAEICWNTPITVHIVLMLNGIHFNFLSWGWTSWTLFHDFMGRSLVCWITQLRNINVKLLVSCRKKTKKHQRITKVMRHQEPCGEWLAPPKERLTLHSLRSSISCLVVSWKTSMTTVLQLRMIVCYD